MLCNSGKRFDYMNKKIGIIRSTSSRHRRTPASFALKQMPLFPELAITDLDNGGGRNDMICYDMICVEGKSHLLLLLESFIYYLIVSVLLYPTLAYQHVAGLQPRL